MANITLRLVKGTPLTNSEVDNNFSNLNITKAEIGGDLGGNILYPTVTGIQGRAVANTAPANLQVLSWSETANTWAPSNAASNYGELQTKPAVNVLITGDVTGSSNVVLLNTNTNVVSINVSYGYNNLDSRFLKLDSPTTQYVTSYVNFQGNVVFGGNVTTIGANNLIITDNFIYINDASMNTNVDVGLVANYNDGISSHTGFFRDASDNGTWKIFEGYIPEPSAAVNIDTDNASFRLANLAVNAISANTLQGIINTNLVTNLNADLLDGQQGTYYTNYANQTNKPDANVTLTGLVSGSANILLSANTNVITILTTSNAAANASFYNLVTSNAVITSSVYASNIYSSGFPVWTANNDGAGSGLDADLLDGQDSVYYTDYVNQIHKPFANIVITGNITGSGNAVLNANTNIITVTTAVAANSVTLGTHTVGNYIANVVQGAAIEVSGGGTEGAVATVSHADTSTLSGLQGGAGIASVTVDGLGHVTAVTSATYLSQPGLNLVFTGDVTGSSNLTISNSTTNLLSVALTVAPNSVALGTDTTGNYTDRVVAGTGISATGTADEGNVITVGLTTTGVTANTYGNATIVPVITVDAQGRVTAASNVTIAFPVASNVFSYAGACRNTITQTCSTHTQITATGFNFFAGRCSGNSITSGENNIFLGECAGKSMTEGTNNFFVGLCAGHFSQQGNYNTFIGRYAGKCNTVGNSNNFLGRAAGIYNTTGTNNNFFGTYAGGTNTVGQHNNFFGSEAGYYNKTGKSNNYFGRKAGYSNACGSYNNIFGHYAGYYNTTGSYNNFIGCYAGRYNTTGCFNNFIGPAAGRSNTTGSRNNFIGCRAGYCNTIGVDNIFVGTCSGHNTTSGSNNVFAGTCAGFCNTTGFDNFFAGLNSGICNTTGRRNIFLGTCAGGNITTGNDNIIVGCINSNTGLTASTSNVFVVATGGLERFRVHSSGQTVIGSNSATPFATSTVPLYVKGGTSGWSVFERNGKAFYLNPNYSDLNTHAQLSPQAADSMALSLSARETSSDLYLTTTGNIGVGTTTPGKKLTISRPSEATSEQLEFRNEGGISTGNYDGIVWTQGASGATTLASIRVNYNSSGSPDMVFNLRNDANVLYLKNGGNVGIGTTTPSTKLHVYESGAADAIFRITPANGSYDGLIQIVGQGNSISTEGFEVWYDNDVGDVHLSTTYADDAASFHFHTRTGASKSTSNERFTILGGGNVGIGTTTPAYKLEVNGSFAATTKSFVIDHPSKPDHRLVYGSLEGPENGVYVRGKLKDSDTIVLPDYWKDLVDEDTITVNLTPIGKYQKLFVSEVSNTHIKVDQGGLGLHPINCYYVVFAERKDVPKLQVEVKK